jgi:fatty-acyl-CoA synthase
MLITEILARNARMFGEQTALIEREPAKNIRREISWQEFDNEANQVAQALMKKGIKKGDRVVHLMMNCLEWLPIYFGILRTGAWAVPVNFRFVAKTIRDCVETAEAKAIFFGEEFIERIDSIKKDIDKTIETYVFIGPDTLRPEYAIDYAQLIEKEPRTNPNVPIDITDEAALYFTSGTTGTPKAALLTHRNLEASCYVENKHHSQSQKDNFLCLPPLYHTGAKMHWFGSFIVGGKAVILKGIKPDWILRVISEEAVTVVWLLVPWAQDILVAIETGQLNLKDYNLSQWRLMHIGAQPVPRSLIREWKRVFPHHDYDTNYGLTEATGPGCVHLGIDNLHKVGAIGLPGFDWETAVVDDNLNRVPRGTIGELIVRGPCVMKCYYRNPEATAEALKDGWLLTGDIAKEDEDGFIYLVDRKKDIIITGGENIYPVEIEDFLQSHPKIQDVAVIGLPDNRLGEVATAVIQVKPGQDMVTEEIDTFCHPLPRYKRPRKVVFGDIPRNPTGKIEKPKLRKHYAGIAESFKND